MLLGPTVSADIVTVLESAGWYRGRCVDTSRWTEAFCLFGIRPFPAAIEVLQEFGGLNVVPTDDVSGALFRSEPFQFNPRPDGNDEITSSLFEQYLGRRVYKIGQTAYDLWIDESGAIYLDFVCAYKYGDSFEAALRHMILRKELPEVFAIHPSQQSNVDSLLRRWQKRMAKLNASGEQ